MSLKEWFYKKIAYRSGMTFKRWNERRAWGKQALMRYHLRNRVKKTIVAFEVGMATEAHEWSRNRLQEQYYELVATAWMNGYLIGRRFRGIEWVRSIYLDEKVKADISAAKAKRNATAQA